MLRTLAAFASLSLLAAAPASAVLSPQERKMTATVDAEQARTLAMLEKWVSQNSGSLNIDGVRDDEIALQDWTTGRISILNPSASGAPRTNVVDPGSAWKVIGIGS